MEAKGEKESVQMANTTVEESNDPPSPSVNLFATVKQHIINGTGSYTFLHALLDLGTDLPKTNFFPSVKKPRCNSLS